tara:strand:- start:11648 stop:13360 length:1713 start_codon:yes stop_codon:yes gene_type:complete
MTAAALPAGAPTMATRPDAQSAVWPAAAIALLLVAQAVMVHTRAINWDEFFYYDEVARFADGHLARALQSIHVRIFSWLPARFSDTIDAIIAGRTVMLGFEMVILGSIFAVARRFADTAGALLCALSYLSAAYVLQHGFSFRADPAATAALMASLALLIWMPLHGPRFWIMAAAGAALAALAAMFTIKAIFYAPPFAGIALLRWRGETRAGSALIRLALFAVMTLAAFAAFYALHASGVTGAAGDPSGGVAKANAASSHLLADGMNRMFFLGMPNNLGMILKGWILTPGLTALAVATPFVLARKGRFTSPQRIALASLWLPVLTFAFYENTASYFFVFMLAPLCVAATAAITPLRDRVPVALIAAALVAPSMAILADERADVLANQRALIGEVHRIFPEPVAYFDHPGMLAGFPKRNGFMTPWGMKGYVANGVPAYAAAMEREPVPLLLTNWWLFGALDDPENDIFLPADTAALRENYVHVTGAIFVAGRDIAAGDPPRVTHFLVPGAYTVIGGPVEFDGRVRQAGEIVDVERGEYRLAPAGQTDARLIWGRHPDLPPRDRLEGALWTRF